MQNYIHGDLKIRLGCHKIRVVKETLCKIINIEFSELVLVYDNVILEDYHQLKHYNIKPNTNIWTGRIKEYMEQFGDHVCIHLKGRNSSDSVMIVETVLMKKSQQILALRSILGRIYKWFDKISLYDQQEKILRDDETVEERNLIDNPVIIVGAPVFVMVQGKLADTYNTTQYRMRLDAANMSPVTEMIRKAMYSDDGSEPLVVTILNFIKMTRPEDADVKNEFITFIKNWLKYLDKEERQQLSNDDKISIYRQNYQDHLEDIDENVELASHNNHLESLSVILTTFEKIWIKYMQFFPVQNPLKSFREIMNAYKTRTCPDVEDKFIDLRFINQLVYFFKKFLNDGEPLSENKQQERCSQLCLRVIPYIQGLNSLIHEYWKWVFYNGERKFTDILVNPILNEDISIQIMTAGDLDVSQTKDIVKNILTKDTFIGTERMDRVLKDEEMLPSDAIISSFNIINNISSFTFKSNLGTSPFSSVDLYECKNTKSYRVLKKIKKPKHKSIDEVNEIMREITAISVMAPHRRIIQYLNFYVEDEYFYIEMEYMKEGSLRTFINGNGNLSVDETRRFSRQILEGLEYLHGKSILHRDIKAENILLDDKKNIKLTDFGLARCFDTSVDGIQINFGLMSNGTERYMAPEICRHGSGTYGSASDVWSFGITVIVMITGSTPFHKIPPHLSRKRLLDNGIKYLIKVPDDNLKHFISCCFKEIPENRSSVTELLQSKFINEDKCNYSL